MQKVTLIATSTFGLESIVADEVKKLGYSDVKVENGKVEFNADISAIARGNLWLRSADRVRLKIAQFEATTFDELFEKTKELPWYEWIEKDGKFPVEGKSIKSTLFSISDCQAIVKKAIVESMKNKHKVDWFSEEGAMYKVEVALLKDIVTLTIDTSGPGLHRRGYRDWIGTAPLKETMAAALIYLSRWKPERPLLDPFCGSGTIPIEAAMIGQNIAPGMNREFASEEWSVIPKQIWRDARAETHDLAQYDRKLQIIGSDIDNEIIKVAKRNAHEAGFNDEILFKRLALRDLNVNNEYGVLICNPPYGERLNERKEVESLYRLMGKKFKSFETWSYFILSSHEGFEGLFGQKASKKRKLYNGNLKVDYYQYYGPLPPFNKTDRIIK